jgi:hypothetical protein
MLMSSSSHANVLMQAYNAREVTIKIVGEIADDDLQDFKDALKKIDDDKSVLHMNAVQLNSDGGNPAVAIEIGKLIRDRRFTTYIAKDDTCASACVYLLIAGVKRYAFGEVLVHRTSFASELPDTSVIAAKIDEWRKRSTAYLASMNISYMLFDAMQSTPNWQVRTLTEDEKRKWQLIGTDQLTEETLFTEIAKERSISREEFIDIYKQSYEQCLHQAKLFNQTTFECAKSRKVQKISYYQYWSKIFKAWVDRKVPTTTFDENSQQKVDLLLKKIHSGSLYLRYMKTESIPPTTQQADKTLVPISKDDVKVMESKNVWWTSKNNSLFVLLANPTTKNIKRVTFSISTTDCSHEGQKRYVSLDLIEALDRYRAVVYSGSLPFDYIKDIGAGEKCGIVEEAFSIPN